MQICIKLHIIFAEMGLARFYHRTTYNLLHMTKDTPKDQDKKDDIKQPIGQPDPETLGTTDPQEHMKGPISSLVHKAEKAVEHNDQDGKKD